MAQQTFTQMVGHVGAALDLDVSSGSEGETSVKQLLNWAARRIWTSRPWYERRAEAILTLVAPYSTGTATFTLDSTAVTGSGTTWAASFSGRKIALGYGRPWYRFTRTGNTTGTIPQAYAEATAAASNYVIFDDEVDVSSTCDIITAVHILNENGGLTGMSEAKMDEGAYVHAAVGIPRVFSQTDSTTAGTRRIRVWPIPDQAYRLRVHYFKSYTDMSSASDLCALGPNKERLLYKAALLEGQTLSDARVTTSEEEVEALIERAWRDQQDRAPLSYKKMPFDAMAGSYGAWLDSTNAFP